MSADADYKQPDVIVYQDIRIKPDGPAFNWSNFDVSGFVRAFAKKRGITERQSELEKLLTSIAAGGGAMGKSAYEVWLEFGNTGSVEDFLNSLIGPKGDDGESAYQAWLSLGNVGSKQDFVNSLVGESGKSAYELWLDQGNAGTAYDFIEYLKNSASFAKEFSNATTVLVEHNMQMYPSVTVVDTDGVVCLTSVRHINNNALRVNMNTPKNGWIYCS